MTLRLDCDAIVVGAGAAGLAAAATLAEAGRSVLLLEARDRIGGRLHGFLEPGLPVPIELGAEFVHGDSPETRAWLRRAGRPLLAASGEHWTLHDGELRAWDEAEPDDIGRLMQGVASLAADESLAAFLERAEQAGLSPAVRARALGMVEGFDAADPARISVRSVAAEWRRGGAASGAAARPQGGYAPLLDALARALDPARVALRLGALVHTVRWSPGEVVVDAVHGAIPLEARAPAALVTLPVGVLQAPEDALGAVRFAPPLPARAGALARVESGPVVKIVLRFRTPFWEDAAAQRYAGAAFFHCPGAAIPTFWTLLPQRAPLLVAWAGGPRAARLAGLSRDALVGHALAGIAALFPGEDARRALVGAWCHDWQADPFARGAYSYLLAGGDAANRELAAPVAATLFFAGEATATDGGATTVEGALASGRRAARELLANAPAQRAAAGG